MPKTLSEIKRNDPTWYSNTHCLALDGVRGFAILAVTLYRLCKELDPSSHPVISDIRRLAPMGERGVDLFFVLSGFLITGILLHSKGKPNYFRNFMVRRALRIFPLYFLSLIVGLLIIPTLIDTHVFDMPPAEQFYLWTYTSNIRMSWLNEWCFGPFDHFWSLAVEEHFYFVWPAVVFFLTRRRLVAVCIGAIVFVTAVRTIAAMNPRWDTAVDVLTIFRADSLAMGALLAIVLNSQMHPSLIRSIAWIVALTSFPLLIGVALTAKRFLGVPNTLCSLFFMAAMAILLTNTKRSLFAITFESTPLRCLGKYSYGMYVVQLPLVTILPLSGNLNWLPSNPLAQSAIYVAGMFGLITCVAIVSFHLLESHFLRLKKLFI